MRTYNHLAGLEFRVEACTLERKEQSVSSGFTRVSTTVVLGDGQHEGRGEDVTYTAEDHERFAIPEVRGAWTLDEFSQALERAELFSGGSPEREADWNYRRWAFESAALDLALRSGNASLGEALGRDYRPVRFVVSTRLDPLQWLTVAPELELKLDPTSDWSREFMDELAATGRVRVLDLKAHYVGTIVAQDVDLDLYRNVVELFPDAVIEDAAIIPETRSLLESARDRLSWDAPIHGVTDCEALEFPPRWLNIKPSRFGSVSELLDTLDWATRRNIGLYGGGQFELGVGRNHIQALASLFYADSPNDVAPADYNAPAPQGGLPRSPLVASGRLAGLDFRSDTV